MGWSLAVSLTQLDATPFMVAYRPLDTTIEVITPENIAFDYQLAGPFRRLPAYLIDFVARWALIFLILLPVYLSGFFLSVFSVGPFLIAATFLVYFVISWFYGTLMETYFNGRTIGKWVTGTRVIEVTGRPVTGRGALLRNLLRIADLAPMYAISNLAEGVPPIYMVPTGLVGLSTMMLTRRMQRLGDLAAGTMVVVDEKRWRIPIDEVDDKRVPALATYLPADYRISRSMARALAAYVERRTEMTSTRRREIAKRLIEPVLDQIGFRPEIDPDLMMYTLYYQAFLRTEICSGENRHEVDLSPLRGYSPLRQFAAVEISKDQAQSDRLDHVTHDPSSDQTEVVQ
ncbi:MAG: RDD family protein [Rubripirellula sp.]